MRTYYNDSDQQACAWVRELMADGLVAEGEVDERPIQKVRAEDLQGFRRVHLFSGIGGWDYALRLAAWPEDRPVWTGSCPCPPFSQAGRKKSCPKCAGRPLPHPLRTGRFVCRDCEHVWKADARHLWPEMLRLVRECRPATVFGEQVAGKDGLVWLAGVRATLEALGYAFGAADLPACSQGAPHIRQRLFWVAYSGRQGHEHDRLQVAGAERKGQSQKGQRQRLRADIGDGRATRRLGDAEHSRQKGYRTKREFQEGCGEGEVSRTGTSGGLEHAPSDGRGEGRAEPDGRGVAGGRSLNGMDDAPGGRRRSEGTQAATEEGPAEPRPGVPGFLPSRLEGPGPWSSAVPIWCADGKWRRVEPTISPLAPRLPGRVGLLRGAGNSIVPQTAAAFIRAFLEAEEGLRGF